MKIAVISDIHGNLEALKTTLTYIQEENISTIICLGDVVGYGPHPNSCTELIREKCRFCLMGNHDHAALGLTNVAYFNALAREAVLWTQEQLEAPNKTFLRSLPYTMEFENALFVHSSPLEPEEWHYVLSEFDAQENFEAVSAPLTFIGHSHVPKVFSESRGERHVKKLTLDLKNDRYIVNVGSVGQPRDGNPKACFVVYDTVETTLEYVRLDYPIYLTYQDIVKNNLPPYLASRLLSGQ